MYRELTQSIISLLRSNLTDPNSDRAAAGKNWIYPDFPREDATMPRVSVVLRGQGEAEYYGVNGGTVLVYPVRYEISVWVRFKETYTIGSEKYGEGKLIDYLCDQIINVIENNAFSLDNVVVAKCVSAGAITLYERNVGIMRRPLEFEFLYMKQQGV